LGACESLRTAAEYVLPPEIRADEERVITAVREAVGDSTFDTFFAAGRAMTREQVLATALGV
jgi:hypothetical protein